MPQGKRKKPFSGKAKKEQLQAKKQSHTSNTKSVFHEGTFTTKPENNKDNDRDIDNILMQKINHQPTCSYSSNPNRYLLSFHSETKQEILERKELARTSLNKIDDVQLEISGNNYFEPLLDFPKRPQWTYEMSREALESHENKYFTGYLNALEKNFSWKELGYFELNLETWRQLWRVLEMSDIVLIVVDIRFPAAMFPPSLYEYVTKTMGKEMILVLNKIDLAPASLVVAWKSYFKEHYPKLTVLMFTSFPGYNLVGNSKDKGGLNIRRRKGRLRMAAEGNQCLLDACKAVVGEQVDLSSWQQKIKDETTVEFDTDEGHLEIGKTITLQATDTSYYLHEMYKEGILTIGCIGQPNVGKSSLLNAVMGKKVVSVSKTPGHTKHFQTIFLTHNVRLCDCPGLIFPSKVPKPIQVLMGSYPIAQLKEPFTAVKFLAERIDLVKLLRIQHPEGDSTWSAMDVCDGWAKQRGFYTAKAARLDSYRAANAILRMALDGKICLCLGPIGYLAAKEQWKTHPEVETVKWIQSKINDDKPQDFMYTPSSDEDQNRVEKPTKITNENSSNSTSEANEFSDEEIVQTNKFSALTVDD